MSETPPHDPPSKHDAKDAKADDNRGTGLKWLAGAAVAVVLLGGAYYALNTTPSTESATEVAATDPTYDSSLSSSLATDPVAGSKATTTQTTTTASTKTTTTSTAASRRSAQASAEVVPEQVIGVSQENYVTTENMDEIVVTAGRKPIWASTPSARRLTALYPARALERGREGEASVHCMVLDDGALDCVRASETPVNAGFGAAALRVAGKFRHAPQRADGSAAAGTPVNLRVLFRIEDNEGRRG